MRSTAAVVFGLLLGACELLAPGAPTQPQACTAIGCESQLRILLAHDLVAGAEYDVQMCVGDHCAEASITVPPGGGAVAASEGPITLATDADAVHYALGEGDWSGMHSVRLTIRDEASGMSPIEVDEEIEFERQQPNGGGCPPICWFAEIHA